MESSCNSSSTTSPTSGIITRHKEDDLPFDLFNPETREFRAPNVKEKAQIYAKFCASVIIVLPPWIVIEYPEPPSILKPLTVGGMLALFVRENTTDVNLDFGRIGQGPRIIADPLLPGVRLSRYTIPPEDVRRKVAETLRREYDIDVVAISYYYNRWIVEVNNGTAVDMSKLPGSVGGLLTYYAERGFWDKLDMVKRRVVVVDPPVAPDRTDEDRSRGRVGFTPEKIEGSLGAWVTLHSRVSSETIPSNMAGVRDEVRRGPKSPPRDNDVLKVDRSTIFASPGYGVHRLLRNLEQDLT